MPVVFFGGQQGATTLVLEATITGPWKRDDWTEGSADNNYYANVSVPGLRETDNPVVDVACDDAANSDEINKAWSKVWKIETLTDSMRVWVGTETPGRSIPVKLLIVR